jgi:hypothetical protein
MSLFKTTTVYGTFLLRKPLLVATTLELSTVLLLVARYTSRCQAKNDDESIWDYYYLQHISTETIAGWHHHLRP